MTPTDNDIRLVGFDGDDTLWRSEDYYHGAQAEFERILGRYVDLPTRARMSACTRWRCAISRCSATAPRA